MLVMPGRDGAVPTCLRVVWSVARWCLRWILRCCRSPPVCSILILDLVRGYAGTIFLARLVDPQLLEKLYGGFLSDPRIVERV